MFLKNSLRVCYAERRNGSARRSGTRRAAPEFPGPVLSDRPEFVGPVLSDRPRTGNRRSHADSANCGGGLEGPPLRRQRSAFTYLSEHGVGGCLTEEHVLYRR